MRAKLFQAMSRDAYVKMRSCFLGSASSMFRSLASMGRILAMNLFLKAKKKKQSCEETQLAILPTRLEVRLPFPAIF
jgi:hypothetical protein